MSAYYNENDARAAAWLRELIKEGHIADGYVDERSISEVQPEDLTPYAQCHFFAGIGGWSAALRIAGIPDGFPVWTGSCPCQPFSVAGKGLGAKDPRHLWPAFRDLIARGEPAIAFGEQVASKDGGDWFSGVRVDLEEMGYEVGGANLCAAGAGAPHTRQRIFWIAHSPVHGREGVQRRLASQIQEDGTSEALGAWNRAGDPFREWSQLLAGTCVRRMDDGVSSNLVVRPALRGFGNAIVPALAAQFILASLEALE